MPPFQLSLSIFIFTPVSMSLHCPVSFDLGIHFFSPWSFLLHKYFIPQFPYRFSHVSSLLIPQVLSFSLLLFFSHYPHRYKLLMHFLPFSLSLCSFPVLYIGISRLISSSLLCRCSYFSSHWLYLAPGTPSTPARGSHSYLLCTVKSRDQ